METTHRVHVGDARSMDGVDDESVELVVTSPPYPMIEMWDDLFADLDPAVADHLDAGDGDAAFEAMHDALDAVWAEVERVLAPGGIACVNVGDATRTVGDRFRVFPNHAEVLSRLRNRGLDPLPDVLWRKPANSGNSFLGAARPPNGYVTLEHEYVLVLRKGERRAPPPDRRAESALFWEERNALFTDLWDDVRGTDQVLPEQSARERSAAFPLEIPYRLLSMFSVYGDTVLDPFWGTGTTSLAAMVAGRNSVGYERDPSFASAFDEQVEAVPRLSREKAAERLENHRTAMADNPDRRNYDAANYDVAVTMQKASEVQVYAVADVERTDEGYVATHEPYDPDW